MWLALLVSAHILFTSQQHAVMEILLDQSPELGKRLPFSIHLLGHAQFSFSIKLHFRDSKGQLIKTVEANDGDDILSIAHEHDIDLEGTAFQYLQSICLTNLHTRQVPAKVPLPAPRVMSFFHRNIMTFFQSQRMMRTTCWTWPLDFLRQVDLGVRSSFPENSMAWLPPFLPPPETCSLTVRRLFAIIF
jgi:hypothetical protein